MNTFAIIGGGVAGLSAAAALAPHGKVTLFEAEPAFGYHASGRSAALFIEHYGNAVVKALNTASAPAHADAGVLTQRPLLMLARAPDRERFESEVAAFGARKITVAEARALLPILDPETVAFAARYDQASDIDTDLVLQTYAKAARASGAELLNAAPVSRIERTDSGWRVSAGERTVEADYLVNAAGAWADPVAALAGVAPLGIRPFRRSMARLAAPGGRDTRAWPFTLDVTEGWYAKPDASAWLVSPCEEDPAEPHDAWPDDMVLAEGLARYQEFVTEEVTRPIASWAGLRSFAPDRALVIGPDASDPAFLWCAGQGGYGFQTAPAAAALLAELVSGRVPSLPAHIVATLLPSRFS